MENKNITGIMVALRGEIKDIVKEAVREVLAEGNKVVFPEFNVAGADTGRVEVKKEEANPHAVAQKAVNKAEGVKEEAPAGDRRAELASMKYNDLKVLVKQLGGKAVGSANSIIDQILEIEANAPAGEEVAPEAKDEAPAPEKDTTPEANNEEGSGDEEDEDTVAFREFLVELDKDALLEIGGKLEVEAPKKWNKEGYVEMLIIDTDALYTALEELGYYDEEDGDKEDLKDDGADAGDDSQDEVTLADELSEKSLEELADLCTTHGLSTKGKKQALVDRLVKAVEAGEISLDDAGEDTTPEGDGEEGSEEWYTQEELDAMSIADLKEIAETNELEIPTKKVKGKAVVDKDALVEAILALGVSDEEEGTGEDAGDEEAWYTKEELEAMSLDDLKEIAETNELEIPTKKVKGKAVVDKVALIEAVLALGEQEEGEGDQEDSEDNSNDSEGSGEGFELSEERTAKEAEIEEGIRAEYKAKKLKDATIKKFLEKYNEGNPAYKAPAKDEALEQYIEIKVGLVDDEGELHDVEDCYIRDGEYACCGKQLDTLENGNPYCSVCGTEYEA